MGRPRKGAAWPHHRRALVRLGALLGPAAAACGAAAYVSRAGPQGGLEQALPQRRQLLLQPILATTVAGTGGEAAYAEAVYRTLKEAPEVPKILAVMLLRTTYDCVDEWGAYKTMATYQKNFWLQLRDGFESFKERYANYNFGELYNATKLALTRSGGVTNRFYFTFLNDAQWRVIGQAIKRPADREKFSRFVGEILYESTLKGVELKNDAPDGPGPASEELAAFSRVGTWPKIAEPLPVGRGPADLRRGVEQLLAYLQEQTYLKGFEISDIEQQKDGKLLKFSSFVREPVNLEATASLMRSNDNFAPRYDQRILQAYFADRGWDSELADELADSLASPTLANPLKRRSGVRTRWTLSLDPDFGRA